MLAVHACHGKTYVKLLGYQFGHIQLHMLIYGYLNKKHYYTIKQSNISRLCTCSTNFIKPFRNVDFSMHWHFLVCWIKESKEGSFNISITNYNDLHLPFNLKHSDFLNRATNGRWSVSQGSNYSLKPLDFIPLKKTHIWCVNSNLLHWTAFSFQIKSDLCVEPPCHFYFIS